MATQGKKSIKQVDDEVQKLNADLKQTQANLDNVVQTIDIAGAQGVKSTQQVRKGVKDINATLVSLQKEARAADAKLARMVITGDAIRKSLVNGMTQSSTAMTTAAVSADRMNAHLHRTNVTTQDVIMNARRMTTAFQYAFALNPVTMFLRKMIEVRGEFEMQGVALQAILQNKDEANHLFDQITQLAVKSPFRVKDLLTYTKQLAAYRIETDQLYDTTKRLADVSAGLGVDMGRLILAYGQVKAANYLRASEIRQFTEAGVNMLGELATYFTETGDKMVSTADVMNMVQKRMVSFEDVAEVFRRMTNEGGIFYDMQEKQSYTVQGQIGKLKDSIDLMLNDIGTAQQGAIKDAVTSLIDLLKNWENVWFTLKTGIILLGSYKAATMVAALATGQLTGAKRLDNAVSATKNSLLQQEIVGNTKVSALVKKLKAEREAYIASLEKQVTQEEINNLVTEQRIANLNAILTKEQQLKLENLGLTASNEQRLIVGTSLLSQEQMESMRTMELSANTDVYIQKLQMLIAKKTEKHRAMGREIGQNEILLGQTKERAAALNNFIAQQDAHIAQIDTDIAKKEKDIRTEQRRAAAYKGTGNKQKELQANAAARRLADEKQQLQNEKNIASDKKRRAELTLLTNAERQNVLEQRIATLQSKLATAQNYSEAASIQRKIFFINKLKAALVGLRALAGGLLFGGVIMGLSLLTEKLTESSRASKELQKNLDEIADEGARDIAKQVNLFNRLANTVTSSASTYKEQQDALSALKREYGELLPEYALELDYLQGLNGDYTTLTDTLKEYNKQKTLQKQLEEIKNQDVSDEESDLANRLETVLTDNIDGVYAKSQEILSIINSVTEDVKNGVVDSQKSREEVIKRTLEFYGRSYEQYGEMVKREAEDIDKNIFRTDTLYNYYSKLVEITNKMNVTRRSYASKAEKETKNTFDDYNRKIKEWDEAWADAHSKEDSRREAGLKKLQQMSKELNLNIDWDKELNAVGFKDTADRMFKTGIKEALVKALEAIKDKMPTDVLKNQIQKMIDGVKGEIRGLAEDKSWEAVRSKLQEFTDANKVTGDNLNKLQNQVLMKSGEDMETYASRLNNLRKSAESFNKTYEQIAKTNKALAEQNKAEYEYNLLLIRAINSVVGKPASSNSGGSKRSENLTSQISLIKELNSEYNKLLKNYDAEAAKLKIVSSYTDAVAASFKDINKKYKTNFSIADIDFTSEEGMVESLKKLEAVAKKMGDDMYAALKKAISPFQAEIDIKPIVKDREAFKSAMDDVIDDYNKTLEASNLGLSSEMAERVFGVGGTKLGDLRFALENYAKNYLKKEDGTWKGEEGQKEYEKWLEKINDMEDKAVQERMKKYVKYLNQSYTEVAAARVKLMQSFIDIDNLDVEDKVKQQMKAGAKRESDEAVGKALWNEFKDSGMYVDLFNNLENASNRAIDAMIERLQGLGEQMKHLDPTQLKAIYEQIEKLEKIKMERGSLSALWNYGQQAREMRSNGRTEDVVDTELQAAREQELQYQQQITNYQILAQAAEQGQFEEMAKQLGIEQEIENACAAGAVSNEQITQYYIEQANAAQANLQNTKTQVSELQKEKNIFNNLRKSNKQFASDWKNVTNTVKGSFNDIMDNLDLFGGEVNNESKAFKEVGNAILDVIAIIPTYVAGMTAAGVAINSAMGIIGLIAEAISLTMGLIKALAGMNDAKEQDKIDALAKSVKQLERDFEDLEKAMNQAMNVGDYASNYDKALANIDERIQKTREMADAERAKKDTDEEKLDEYADNVKDLEEEREKLKQQLIEDWGGIGRDNWRSMAEDFVSAWMDAFEETGDGLEGLEKKFDEWLKNWFQKQATMKVASAMLAPLFEMIDDMTSKEQGLGLDANEMEQIRQRAAEIFPQLNESLKEMWEAFDMGGGAVDSLTGLQQGIEGITEATAEVIEGYLNSIRYFIAEDNAILMQIRDSIVGGVNGSGITTYLQNIVTILNRIDSKIPDMSNGTMMGGVQGLNVRILPD